MITISDGLASVLVAAIRDSFKRNSELIDATEVGDVSDLEQFLVSLGLLEGEVRRQYLVLQSQNKQMTPYERLWPEILTEPAPDPGHLKPVK